MSNNTLHKAKEAKNDEFYTQLTDIEKELYHYKDHFKDKVVFCNCDDPEYSNFWHFFSVRFNLYGLKKLISTHYEPSGKPSYMLSMERIGNETPTVIKHLKGDGDFRSAECVELLKEADIVVTNPPFSLFREYIGQLMEYDKKFIVIGNLNAVTYKEFFPLLMGNQVWMGATCFNGGATYFVGDPELYDPKKMSNPRHAYVKDGKLYWRVNGVRWYTNLDIKKRHEELKLYRHYTPEEYPKYANYDVIEVGKVVDIPCDYDGVMGVPVSFMDKYCPEQFDIVGMAEDNGKGYSGAAAKWDGENPHCLIDGKAMYKRIFIRRKT